MPERPILPARLLEAREYLGFTREEVAAALRCPVQVIEALENGTARPRGPENAAKLARLYRRPLWWLQGETRYQPGEDLLRKTEGLTPGDREAVLDFAEWLRDAGPAPARRCDG